MFLTIFAVVVDTFVLKQRRSFDVCPLMEHQHFAGDLFQSNAADARIGSREMLLDHGLTQANRLKSL